MMAVQDNKEVPLQTWVKFVAPNGFHNRLCVAAPALVQSILAVAVVDDSDTEVPVIVGGCSCPHGGGFGNAPLRWA